MSKIVAATINHLFVQFSMLMDSIIWVLILANLIIKIFNGLLIFLFAFTGQIGFKATEDPFCLYTPYIHFDFKVNRTFIKKTFSDIKKTFFLCRLLREYLKQIPINNK